MKRYVTITHSQECIIMIYFVGILLKKLPAEKLEYKWGLIGTAIHECCRYCDVIA